MTIPCHPTMGGRLRLLPRIQELISLASCVWAPGPPLQSGQRCNDKEEISMLIIHHLIYSRSDRIVWLAEELGINYEMVKHYRDPQTFRSPPSLWEISPMGKAPIIQDGNTMVFESGAVTE